ncbi:YciI family protein [Corynebacterium nasicanis]|uniref:YciI family protein n=1 Tax=Corynebacterium nasicanis TaxID=1448267 RepID=A0ABW1Q930_9CORY
MKHFAVHYQYPEGSADIVRLRPEHRAWLASLLDVGRLVASGPYTDGSGGALIVIRLPETATLHDAAELMDQDPFTREGVLAGREIREWNPVLNVFRAPDED